MNTHTSRESKADRLMQEEEKAQARAFRESRRENSAGTSWWNNATTLFILIMIAIIAVICIFVL